MKYLSLKYCLLIDDLKMNVDCTAITKLAKRIRANCKYIRDKSSQQS